MGREGDQALQGGYEEGEDAYTRGAAGVTVGCQGIITLPDSVHELGIATKPAHIYTYGDSRAPVSQCVRNGV